MESGVKKKLVVALCPSSRDKEGRGIIVYANSDKRVANTIKQVRSRFGCVYRNIQNNGACTTYWRDVS